MTEESERVLLNAWYAFYDSNPTLATRFIAFSTLFTFLQQQRDIRGLGGFRGGSGVLRGRLRILLPEPSTERYAYRYDSDPTLGTLKTFL